jgi:hypothetical protein
MKVPVKFVLAMALGAALLPACSTPEARNEADPGVYSRLAPADQALVREGRVAVGFDRDAVRLALGDPDRVVPGTGGEPGDAWLFTSWHSAGRPLFTGAYHAYRRHGLGWGGNWGPAYAYFLDYPDRVAVGRIRVVFDGERVASVTTESLRLPREPPSPPPGR